MGMKLCMSLLHTIRGLLSPFNVTVTYCDTDNNVHYIFWYYINILIYIIHNFDSFFSRSIFEFELLCVWQGICHSRTDDSHGRRRCWGLWPRSLYEQRWTVHVEWDLSDFQLLRQDPEYPRPCHQGEDRRGWSWLSWCQTRHRGSIGHADVSENNHGGGWG